MIAIRLLFALAAIAIILSLLGYAVTRSPGWLRMAGLSLKAGMALIAVLMVIYLMERLVIAL